ncbi:MAG: DUF6036 family nucleotidyltransferase [Chitinispirillia bacterium]|jgi:hypothetical protein
MKLNQENLEKILHLLGERLALTTPDKRWNLIVCGGAALAALNLVQRTTKDIDVIGQFTGNHIEYAGFDSKFSEQISIISESLNLPPNWINTGPESFIKSGLPEGLLKRLVIKKYGENLTIGFISRYDQIFLKLYASVDRGGYHVDDLIILRPSKHELLDACKWICEQDTSEEFAALLKSMLEQIGFGDVARKV